MLNRALARLGLPLPDTADGAGRACAWVVAISIVPNGSRRFVLVVVVVVVVAETVMVMSGLTAPRWVGCFCFGCTGGGGGGEGWCLRIGFPS